MRGGRAGMISAASRKNHNLSTPFKKQSELSKYGLEPVQKRPIGHETSKKFKPTSQAHQQVPVDFEKNNHDGFYDHHAEILAQRREMEAKDKAAMMNDLESDRIKRESGVEEDFDDIEKLQKQNHPPARGDYQLRTNQYTSEAERAGEYAGINIQEINEHRLIFRKIPYVIWLCGIFILLSGLYLIYHLTLGHMGVLFEGYREGHWWQYFISICVALLGVTFIYAGKVHTIIFDKNSGILSKVKTTIFCKKDQTDWAIDQIKNVRVFKRGHDGVQVMTIHYEVQIDFADVPSETILETKEEDKAIKQLAQIKTFIGLPIGKHDLKYINQSTSRYDRKRNYQY